MARMSRSREPRRRGQVPGDAEVMSGTPADRSRRNRRGRRNGYLRILHSGWLVIVPFILIGVAVAVFDIERTPKAYVATAQVFVTTSDVKDTSGLYSGDQFSLSRVQTYVSLVTNPSTNITAPVREKLGLALTDKQLSGMVTADAPLNKVLVRIHVRDGSALRAADIANAVADQFIVVVKQIETVQRTTETAAQSSPLKLTVTHPADVPSAPVAPQKKLLLLSGFFGGLVAGLLVVFVRERVESSRVSSSDDVEEISGSPALGVIPFDKRAPVLPNAFDGDSSGARAEAYRQLRTNLQFVDVDKPPRSIAVTSPMGEEGSTSVALNLAVSLAEVGVKVVLIETNLRSPQLARLLGLNGRLGLTSLLIGSSSMEEALQHVSANLAVVTSGQLPFNPSELLATKQARVVIADLVERFDCAVFDATALLPIADGAEVVSMADVAVLVVRTGRTSREHVRDSFNTMSRVGARLAGVVLNQSSARARAVQVAGLTRPTGGASETAPPNRRGRDMTSADGPSVAVRQTAGRSSTTEQVDVTEQPAR